jgi:uroporphyrinogen III methyltransferase/synthase
VKGKVSLVGSGPGDPGLLTVKALRLIRRADLIVYDTLANPEHLVYAKKSAVKLCVGKRFRHQPFSQKKIHEMILKAAQKGKNVVRLKGGDPYLFGRGGEEALYLAEHKIPFEVVPGVTSATACAAYAGIPLTHRQHNASVTFLTGHRAQDERLDSIDWKKLVAVGGTLVIYMGFYNLGNIAKRLIAAGMSAAAKVCVIEWGTLPRQKSCDGTLLDIEKKVRKQNLSAPAIIIVGEVVSLRKKLGWFEKLPLFGKKVVITRSLDKALYLKDRLAAQGAEVLEFPVIEIKPLENQKPLDAILRRLTEFDWIVFTSTYGVEAFFERLWASGAKDARALGKLCFATVGPGTSQALLKKGIHVDLEPERYETKAIVEAFKKKLGGVEGTKILLLRTNIAPPALEKGLKALGAEVTRVTAYLTRMPKSVPVDVKRQLLGGKVDFVTFTSSSTVDHFVKILGIQNVRKMARHTRFSSIGPVTSQTLKKHGLKVGCQAKTFTIEGLVDALSKN